MKLTPGLLLREKKTPPYFDETIEKYTSTGNMKDLNTHIWIIVYCWDQVVNEGLQGPGHQVVVMIKEAGVALLLGLVQVLVVAAGVQLPRERWCLRHVVLQAERQQRWKWHILPQKLMQDGQTNPK